MKTFSLIALLALRIVVHPPMNIQQPAPFTSPTVFSQTSINVPAKLISFEGRISSRKVLLNWAVSENETADQFQVEKSDDGIHFRLAALVFGTDQPETGLYKFYENAGEKKVSYRIKLINKNKETVYSSIIEINPHVG